MDTKPCNQLMLLKLIIYIRRYIENKTIIILAKCNTPRRKILLKNNKLNKLFIAIFLQRYISKHILSKTWLSYNFWKLSFHEDSNDSFFTLCSGRMFWRAALQVCGWQRHTPALTPRVLPFNWLPPSPCDHRRYARRTQPKHPHKCIHATVLQ